MAGRFEGCTLAIIAGGRGSRLGGVVKARLRDREGRTLLQRTLDVVGPLVDDVIVVAGDASLFPGLRVVPDVIADRGAPGGVHAACRASRTEWVLALASDLPFVSPDVLQLMWAAREGVDVVVARTGPERLEPLHGFYRQACADVFEPLLLGGAPGFLPLLVTVRSRIVDEEVRAIDPQLRSFENVNTPDDLVRAGLMLPED